MTFKNMGFNEFQDAVTEHSEEHMEWSKHTHSFFRFIFLFSVLLSLLLCRVVVGPGLVFDAVVGLVTMLVHPAGSSVGSVSSVW